MSLSIRTNVSSLNAQRNLAQTNLQLDSSLSRLSSGYRITKAGDDAAGLGISVNLEAQIRSYQQAARNANDGISLVQTAEGALNEATNILTRLRELAMQSASAGVGDSQRVYIGNEATQLTEELDRMYATAKFNGNTIFGVVGGLAFQVGIYAGATTDAITVDTSAMAWDSASILAGGITLTGATLATAALAVIDTAIESVSGFRATLGAAGNRFNLTVASIQSTIENFSAANSRIRDVDVAEETSKLTRAQILNQAGVSVLAQANQMPQLALKLLG
jgi:flagellin